MEVNKQSGNGREGSEMGLHDFLEAKKIGVHTRPVILGPITFLMLAKTNSDFNCFNLLPNLLLAYQQLFIKLQEIGVTDLQIDEPFLVTDLNSDVINAYLHAFVSNIISAALRLMSIGQTESQILLIKFKKEVELLTKKILKKRL